MGRPTVGKLTVPYVVDDRLDPIDFKIMHMGHVRKCAEDSLCGICGKRMSGYFAFIGPNDGRRCFADPWMHPECAQLAMVQCPFLSDRHGWREHDTTNPVVAEFDARYEHNMALFLAPSGRSHRDQFNHWHFEALGEIRAAPVLDSRLAGTEPKGMPRPSRGADGLEGQPLETKATVGEDVPAHEGAAAVGAAAPPPGTAA